MLTCMHSYNYNKLYSEKICCGGLCAVFILKLSLLILIVCYFLIQIKGNVYAVSTLTCNTTILATIASYKCIYIDFMFIIYFFQL